MPRISIWSLIKGNRSHYVNHKFDIRSESAALLPIPSMKVVRVWPLLYLKYDESFLGHIRYLAEDWKGEVLTSAVQSDSGRRMVVWEPDDWSNECHDCNQRFTWYRRRHHCRSCGKLFCHTCTNQRILLKQVNMHNKVRVCEKCADLNQDSQPPDVITIRHTRTWSFSQFACVSDHSV
jgi:hypothetical protein